MLNNVNLMGRLVEDPQVTEVKGNKICAFTIAVQRSRNRDKTDFIPVKAWSNLAETIAKFFHKGERIVITGNLQNNSYKADDGKYRSFFEVEVESFEFVEQKK